MDEDHYLVQMRRSLLWDSIVLGKFSYTDEESEAKALSQAEELVHNHSRKFSHLDFRIIQVKVVMFVPRKD